MKDDMYLQVPRSIHSYELHPVFVTFSYQFDEMGVARVKVIIG